MHVALNETSVDTHGLDKLNLQLSAERMAIGSQPKLSRSKQGCVPPPRLRGFHQGRCNAWLVFLITSTFMLNGAGMGSPLRNHGSSSTISRLRGGSRGVACDSMSSPNSSPSSSPSSSSRKRGMRPRMMSTSAALRLAEEKSVATASSGLEVPEYHPTKQQSSARRRISNEKNSVTTAKQQEQEDKIVEESITILNRLGIRSSASSASSAGDSKLDSDEVQAPETPLGARFTPHSWRLDPAENAMEAMPSPLSSECSLPSFPSWEDHVEVPQALVIPSMLDPQPIPDASRFMSGQHAEVAGMHEESSSLVESNGMLSDVAAVSQIDESVHEVKAEEEGKGAKKKKQKKEKTTKAKPLDVKEKTKRVTKAKSKVVSEVIMTGEVPATPAKVSKPRKNPQTQPAPHEAKVPKTPRSRKSQPAPETEKAPKTPKSRKSQPAPEGETIPKTPKGKSKGKGRKGAEEDVPDKPGKPRHVCNSTCLAPPFDFCKNASASSGEGNTTCKLLVMGDPVALKRPRHIFGGHTYDPNFRDKKIFLANCKGQLPESPLEGPVCMSMVFEMPRAKTHFHSRRQNWGELRLDAPMHPDKVPDLDNLIKFVLDALNEKVYKDDKQICQISARKVYRVCAGPGRTHIEVSRLISPELVCT